MVKDVYKRQDAQGRKVSFKNTIIIMTSNAGAGRIVSPKHLGFGTGEDENADYQKMKESVMEEVKRIFKPEFINRIDEILVFHTLTKENIEQIVRILLRGLNLSLIHIWWRLPEIRTCKKARI